MNADFEILFVIGFLLALLLIFLVVVCVLLIKKNSSGSDSGLEQQVQKLQSLLDQKLTDSQRLMHDQFRVSQEGMTKNLDSTISVARDSTQKIEQLTKKMVQLEETNKRILWIWDQLKGIEDIFKNPKQRWVLGEYYLDTLLANIFQPGQYQMQYTFTNGEIVDAALFVQDRIIPIDSKFSLENYNRLADISEWEDSTAIMKSFVQDIKNRINETSKYVRPSEGTMDFAFMFLPSESMYYDLLVNRVGVLQANTQDLIEYAFKKRVIIVSPTSLYAYLQTVIQGLNSLKIEQHAQEIRKHVWDLSRHLQAYEVHLEKLGNTLGTSMNHFDRAKKEWGKVDKDVVKITDGEKKKLSG